MSATTCATQASTALSPGPVSSKVMQSFPGLLSSFSKQPLDGSIPPSNLATTLSTQPAALGSATLPGVSDAAWHLSNPAPFFDMHFVFPARHFACWADAGAPHTSSSAITSAVTIERVIPASRVFDMASLPSGNGRLELVQTVAEMDLGCQVKADRSTRSVERSLTAADPA